MRNKKLLFTSLSVIFPVAISATVLSCSQYKTFKLNKTYKLAPKDFTKVGNLFNEVPNVEFWDEEQGKPVQNTNTFWEIFRSIKAKITRVRDGDTVDVEVLEAPKDLPGWKNKTIKVGDTFGIRIRGIDTFEEYDKATPEEKRLGAMDHAFANTLIPVGTVVRVVSTWTDKTYDRYVGNVFFGKNFERNFATEMLAGGFTLPRIEASEWASFKSEYSKTKKTSPMSFLLPYMAYAFNYGIKNRKGFYENEFKDVYDFGSHYKSHGDMINSAKVLLSKEYWSKNKIGEAQTKDTSIFKYIEYINKQDQKKGE